MIVANIKSAQDLQAKKDLQKQLIELEIANENERQKRFQERGIREVEGKKIVEQYKTPSEIQKDKVALEKKTLDLLIDFGFNYNEAGQLTNHLSSLNRLADFITSYKTIKKDIQEKYDKSIVDTEFLKNYLDNYFEDLDTNLGKKFSSDKEMKEIPNENTFYDYPSKDFVEDVINLINEGVIKKDIPYTLKENAIKTNAILEAYKDLLPNNLFRDNSKISQNERAKLNKSLFTAFNRLNYITQVEMGTIRSRIAEYANNINSKTDIISNIKSLNEVFGRILRQLSNVANAKSRDAVLNVYRYYNKLIASTPSLSDDIDAYIIDAKLKEADESYLKLIKTLSNPFDEGRGEQLSKVINKRLTKIELESQLNEVELNALIKFQKLFKEKLNKAKMRSSAQQIVEEIMRDALRRVGERDAEIINSEIFEDLTGDNDKLLSGEEQLNIILDFITEDPSAEAKVDTLIEAIQQEEADVELERSSVVGLEPKIPQQQARQRNLEIFYEELEKLKPKDRILTELRNTANSLGIPKSEYSLSTKSSLKKMISARYLAQTPIEASSRKPYQPEGLTVGLGLGVLSKLKKHFKGDEALLKKVVKALEDSSSSDEEESKELSRHVKATEGVDRKLELLTKKGKGGVSDFLFNAEKQRASNRMKSTYGFDAGDVRTTFGGSTVPFKATRIPVSKVGKGVKLENEENPTYRQFGKYVIHIPHLLNSNTANFKYPSLGGIPSIKPLTVSNDYKDLIIDVLQTGKLNKKEFERLPQAEIKHFERVALGAGLVEQLGMKLGNTEEDKADSKRFELLRGEYLAGNNNQALIKELRLLITKFINNGRIHKNEGLNLLLELSTL